MTDEITVYVCQEIAIHSQDNVSTTVLRFGPHLNDRILDVLTLDHCADGVIEVLSRLARPAASRNLDLSQARHDYRPDAPWYGYRVSLDVRADSSPVSRDQAITDLFAAAAGPRADAKPYLARLGWNAEPVPDGELSTLIQEGNTASLQPCDARWVPA